VGLKGEVDQVSARVRAPSCTAQGVPDSGNGPSLRQFKINASIWQPGRREAGTGRATFREQFWVGREGEGGGKAMADTAPRYGQRRTVEQHQESKALTARVPHRDA